MLLRPKTPLILNFSDRNLINVSPSSNISNTVLFSSGILHNSNFYPKQSILSNSKRRKTPTSISCSSLSQVRSYGGVSYVTSPKIKWKDVFKKISLLEDQTTAMGAASVLNQAENERKYFSKWEINRIVRELRKFKRYKSALEVFEWMNNRPEKYRLTTSDTAIHLDLIAKVRQVSIAEKYFMQIPDSLKDKRVYGALLNVYAQARMREKAESLMDKIRNLGYTEHCLPFNVMMTLYMNLNEHEKIESLVSEMKEKKVELDNYSYNIWLSSCGSQGSTEKMEQVFEKMESDTSITTNWTTFSTMATVYIRLEQLEKAEKCLQNIESRLTGLDRLPYHYLISLYASVGKKKEVYRVWNVYKAIFVSILNLGYHTMISALVRLEDIDGAEDLYDEWLSVKSVYDPRVGNLLFGWYVRKGLSEKAETFFEQMIGMGGKPNAMSWEILAENHINNGRISDALSCLKNATSALGSKSWKPKPMNVASIMNVSEEGDDKESKDVLMDILKQVGCFDDESYMSSIHLAADGSFTGNLTALEADGIETGGYDDLLGQIPESL